MLCPRWAIRFLTIVLGACWIMTGPLRAQDSARLEQARAGVARAQVPAAFRARVEEVLKEPTLYAHGPTEAFAGQPLLYDWLLDHPDRGVVAWRRLGAKCAQITDRGGGVFVWTDGHGSEVRWQTLCKDGNLRLWFAEGKVRPSLFLPPIPVQVVVLLRHGNRPDGPGRTLLFHQTDVFLHTDNKTALLIAQLLPLLERRPASPVFHRHRLVHVRFRESLRPSRSVCRHAPHLAARCLDQLEMCFSGLVWYLDQHPERTQCLLATNRGDNMPLVRRP